MNYFDDNDLVSCSIILSSLSSVWPSVETCSQETQKISWQDKHKGTGCAHGIEATLAVITEKPYQNDDSIASYYHPNQGE